MSDRTSSTLLRLERRQLWQLEELNAQYRQQQEAQRRQAILVDVLFQTEQRAQQLAAVAARDPLVAAMFAEEWLGVAAEVTTDRFDQIEHKRAWQAAVSRLKALTRPLADPAARAMLQQVRAVYAETEQLYRTLGNVPNPDAHVAMLRQRHAALVEQTERAKKTALALAGAGCVVPAALFVVAMILVGLLGSAGGTCGASLVVLSLLGLTGACGGYLLSWSERKKQAQRTEEDLSRFQHALAQLQALSADPHRGGLLARFYAEHPALSGPSSNANDARPHATTRCRYCTAQTPVYAATCQSCGRQGFA